MSSPGLDKVYWFKPLRPNDKIHCIVTVKAFPRSKSELFGVTRILIEIFNKKKELAAVLTTVWFLKTQNSNK